MSKPLCLLTLSLAPLREAHWAASSVVFKMFLHFWPRFSGTKVFLSTASLMPGFYRWLLNTGGTPQEALPQLKSPRFPLRLTRAAEPLMAHAPPWHEPARDRAAAAPPVHGGRPLSTVLVPITPLPRESLRPLHRVAEGKAPSNASQREAKSFKPCLHLLASIALGTDGSCLKGLFDG